MTGQNGALPQREIWVPRTSSTPRDQAIFIDQAHRGEVYLTNGTQSAAAQG